MKNVIGYIVYSSTSYSNLNWKKVKEVVETRYDYVDGVYENVLYFVRLEDYKGVYAFRENKLHDPNSIFIKYMEHIKE
jgi:hypothetical protein